MDSIKFEQLRIFVEVVEKGSFAAVAQRKGMNPSSISRSIQNLEQMLKIRLFQRNTRHLFLTQAGEIYYQSVKPLLEEFSVLHQRAHDIQNSLKGTLKMTLPPGFAEHLVLPILPKFMAMHPELQLDLVITDECQDLEKEQIDLGIRIGPISEPSWIAKPLLNFGLQVCAAPNISDIATLQHPNQLSSHPQVLAFLSQSHWRFLHKPSGQSTVVDTLPRINSSSVNAIHQLCLQGNGIAILPGWLIADDVQQGRLVPLFAEYEICMEHSLQAWLIFPSKAYLPNKTRQMIDFLYEAFAD